MQLLSPDFIVKHGLRKIHNAQRKPINEEVRKLTKNSNWDKWTKKHRWIPSNTSKYCGNLSHYNPTNVLIEKLKAANLYDIYFKNQKNTTIDEGINTFHLKTVKYNALVEKYEIKRKRFAKLRKEKINDAKKAFLKTCEIELGRFTTAETQTEIKRTQEKEIQCQAETNDKGMQSKKTKAKEKDVQCNLVLKKPVSPRQAPVMVTEIVKEPVQILQAKPVVKSPVSVEIEERPKTVLSKGYYSDPLSDASWENDTDSEENVSLTISKSAEQHPEKQHSSCSEVDMADEITSPSRYRIPSYDDKVRNMRFRLAKGDSTHKIRVKLNGEKNAIHHSLSNKPEYNDLIISDDDRKFREVMLKQDSYVQSAKGKRAKKKNKNIKGPLDPHPEFVAVKLEIAGGREDDSFQASTGEVCKIILDTEMTKKFFPDL